MLSIQVNTSAPPPYTGYVSTTISAPAFPERLAALRKQHSLTQQTLAERFGVPVVQLRQPTLTGIQNIATALQDERGPGEEKRVTRSLLEGMILKHEARRWSGNSGGERK